MNDVGKAKVVQEHLGLSIAIIRIVQHMLGTVRLKPIQERQNVLISFLWRFEVIAIFNVKGKGSGPSLAFLRTLFQG
jgi:hypothetical protein